MSLVTIDFETFYSTEYSLTKMSTEDYVCDPRFEVILVGIKVDNAKPYWITGTKAQIHAHLLALKLEQHAILCHNTMFDGLILAVHFNIYPKLYMDSLLMAQAILKPFSRSISLDSCLKQIDLGIQKGDAVYTMKGRPRQSLSSSELATYGEYCTTDCEGEYRLFKYLVGQVPKAELEVIDMTLRMYLQPAFQLDANLLAQLLQEVRAKKEQAINSLPPSVTKSDLMSNPKFAEILASYGVEVPIKISATTGEPTFALAKTDTGWKELEDEWADDPVVSALLASRISAKSTLEESRLERLVQIALNYPLLRAPLKYYAAHTGRYGGTEGINLQNLPRVDKSRMRFALRAPKGHVVLAADLAQIEARITAWLAKQTTLLDGFRNREDIYSVFATKAFGIQTVKDRSPEDKKRRFIGKTCILGLGFGMSAKKLQATLRKDGVKVDILECTNWVNTYRSLYSGIPALWRELDRMLPFMAGSHSGKLALVRVGPLTLVANAVRLPNGMALVYHNLRHVKTDKYEGYAYDFAGETRTLWGGKLTENIVQALARIMIMEHMLRIKHTLQISPALQQHDELDYIVPVEYAEKTAAAIGKIMRVPPTWAPDLPVEVEINYGPTLGDCK